MVLPTVTGASKGQHTESSRSPASTQAAYCANMSRDGTAGLLRPSPSGSASGRFVPKPSSQVGSQVLSADWPAETVRGCPRESADERDDRHAVSHSGSRTLLICPFVILQRDRVGLLELPGYEP